MARLVGVDGCPKGWVAVSLGEDRPALGVGVHRSAAEVLAAYPDAAAIAVDIPLGLTESGARACDGQARALLGRPRASSVFPAPIRPVLSAPTREEASRLQRALDGRGVGAQAWAIVARVREWDTVLRQRPAAAERVFEAHPEVSFWALNGERAIAPSKRTPEGHAARRRLLVRAFGRQAIEAALGAAALGARPDDVLDAIACLWTARRIAQGAARAIPAPPERDGAGLPMAIWY